MNKKIAALAAVMLLAVAVGGLFAQDAPEVSAKKEIAIFSLGYYGWSIPAETLGTIDIEIQKVFVDLGRFSVIGLQQRFAAGDVDQFISMIKKIKEESVEIPESVMFGETAFTEADFNRLVGAFIIAIPVVSSYNSAWNDSLKQYETQIKTNVTFLNVATGVVIGIADVETSGSSKETEFKAIKAAIDAIPSSLEFEIRKIPDFQISTRVLAASGGEVKIQLGRNMGLRQGWEFSVIQASQVEGFKDDREVGLVLIKDVGAEVSTGTVLYSDIPLGKDAQLREIPRAGIDFDVYFHMINYFTTYGAASSYVVGAKAALTNGFYDLKPFVAVQAHVNGDLWYAINAIVGGQYDIYMGRLQIGGYAGVGGATNLGVYIYEQMYSTTDKPYFTHYGAQAGAYAGYLIGRDFKIFAEVGGEFWMSATTLGSAFSTYGGITYGIGATLKM